MAYGQFTGYEPHPEIPGAYNFQTAGGNPYTFGGAEADALKARLDASNQGQMVAGDNAAPGPVTPANAAAADPNAFANQIAQHAQEYAAAHPPADKPYVQNEINTGIKLDAQGRPYKDVAGSRGTSKADLEKRAGEGVATPTAESQSVTGGFEKDPEYQANKAASYGAEREAVEQKRDADITAQEQGRAVAGQQFDALTAQVQQQQALTSQVQAHVDQAQAVRDQALKEYTSTKIDPNRIFSGSGGTFKSIAAALAAGAGAYGAAINHTQNFAQQVIDNAIGRDVAAQEADLRTKKDASDNALGDLVRRGMSLDQAKGTLATIQRNWASQQLQLAQGASGTDQINANSTKMLADLQQKQLDESEQYRQHSLGTATKAVQAQILHPVAGSAGGRQYLTPEQAMSLADKKTGTEEKIAGTAKTIGDAEAAAAKAKGGAKPNAGAVDVQAGMHELNQFDQAFKAAGDPHIFLEHGPLASKESEELSSKADVLAPGMAAALSGQKRNPKLAATIAETLKHGGPKARALIEQMRDHLQSRLSQEQSKGPGGGGLQQAFGDAIEEEQAGAAEP